MARRPASAAEKKRANNAAFAFYGLPQFKSKVREYKARKPSGKPLERTIVAAIIKALRKHPLVAHVQRRTVGLFQAGDRTVSVGQRGEPDIQGMLLGGRAFAIEVKRPGEDLQPHQLAVIQRLNAAGALAGVAHSVEEALALLA